MGYVLLTDKQLWVMERLRILVTVARSCTNPEEESHLWTAAALVFECTPRLRNMAWRDAGWRRTHQFGAETPHLKEDVPTFLNDFLLSEEYSFTPEEEEPLPVSEQFYCCLLMGGLSRSFPIKEFRMFTPDVRTEDISAASLKMFALVVALAALVGATAAPPSLSHLARLPASETEPEEVRSAAIKRLLEVFGMEDPPVVHGTKLPPQYMLDLYNAVAGVDGVTKDPHVLEGNTVRGFFDKLYSDQVEFSFSLSMVARTEKILTAEFHLFKLRPQADSPLNRHHFSQVSIYRLMDDSRDDSTQKKLLSSRLIPVYSSGWEVFTITQAVRSWMTDEYANLRLHVVMQTLGGTPMDEKLIRFATGRQHHQSKQAMLVLFTDDGRYTRTLESTDHEDPFTISSLPEVPMPNPPFRSTRSLDYNEDDGFSACQRHPLYVDFEEIGWSGWIVSPKGYNAYHCKGSCAFPLGQTMNPTNHATVQSIINALKLVEGVQMPCCVPGKLHSINLLYFDEDENVVLKQYNDMVAGSCGCY
ncbi:anti-dorsalizing morphogenic protein [Pholidichthys leucotaenia]